MDTSKFDNQHEWIKALIDDPAYGDNPLKPALVQLFQNEKKSRIKLDRLMSLADAFGHLHIETLIADYERLAKRLEKITRISDRYQKNMMDLNQQLQQAAFYDPLTKLPNRRFFLPKLKEENSRSQHEGSPFCLAMLDIDFFKRFNDDFGHEVGDVILCRIAKAISVNTRENDHCARWGGEEFILLLRNTPVLIATGVMERIRKAVNSIDLSDIGEGISSSTSIGLTVCRVGENYNDTIKRADTALLQAKRTGRNRVEIIE